MKRTIMMLLFVCVGLAACTGQNSPATGQNGVSIDANKSIVTADDANLVSYEALWSQADAVFMGEVTYISPTIAETGFNDMFHQVAFSVVDVAVDNAGVGSGVVMLVPGQSPVDDILVVRGGEQLTGTAVHTLQRGDQTVVFARMKNLENSEFGQSVLVPAVASEQLFYGTEHWANVKAFASVVATIQ